MGIDVPTTETQGGLILHLLLIRACDAATQIFTALEERGAQVCARDGLLKVRAVQVPDRRLGAGVRAVVFYDSQVSSVTEFSTFGSDLFCRL